MSQKVIATFECTAEDIKSNERFTNQEPVLKSIDQALDNVFLGMEMVASVEKVYGEVEAMLSQIKHWVSLNLATNLEDSQKTLWELKVSMKLKELDLAAQTLTHKGQKLLDGTLSAAVNTHSHSFLLVGTISSPENRINLNSCLNIPSINSKQNGLKGLMMLENAFEIIIRLKQRSTALGARLKEISQHLSIASENYHAANMKPDSFEQTREFIRVVTDFTKENKRRMDSSIFSAQKRPKTKKVFKQQNTNVPPDTPQSFLYIN